MARSTRRSFAAPLVLTIAGGCAGPVHRNPGPPPMYAEWTVVKTADGKCTAHDASPMECPEGASCNPPPPMPVECPADIQEGESRRMWQQRQGEDCFVDP